MFARSVAKYLLLTGLTVAFFNISVMADDSLPSDFSSSEPPSNSPKKQVLSKEELLSSEYLSKLSQTYGHLIRRNLDSPAVKLNISDVIKGIEDANNGKPAPLKDSECDEGFRLLEKYSQEEMLRCNLEEAENFLRDNGKLEGVVELEQGKVQYKILKAGQGETVTQEVVPTIHYSATYLNGMSLGSSDQHGGPIEVPLDETISGFRLGMLGMQVGEKRRLFVHPDHGYKSSGQLPNGLLIFDIEVIKVAPKPAMVESAPDSFDSNLLNTSEEVFPSDDDDNEEEGVDDDNYDIADLETDIGYDEDNDYEESDEEAFRPPMMIDTSELEESEYEGQDESEEDSI